MPKADVCASRFGLRPGLWVAAALLMPVAPLPAQGFCFHGRPQARCSAFLVTEAGAALSVPTDDDPNITFQTGVLFNVGPRSAVGGVLLGGAFQNDARLGARVRYRHWLTPKLTLDVAPGLLFVNDAFTSQEPGFSGEVSVGYGEWAAVTAQLEVLPFEFATETRAFFGLKLGSYPGAAATVGAALWVAILYALISGADFQ
ncbi:MAG: hypothetical protein OEO20_12480 [Gemmatimonadota bacterium]|nr:hypothetical protein [Gemmatimonadota bacterium]MDH3368453.1 hypothetical protein [Gemmatimonadota bacterium]MDH3479110.1 hypothetical protein [Gemmatimonadota bacterium]MDH3570328.1 hypothetical protein [Gemmatimonadota bacterium]MDH5550424.1 hypothetical protein [Gemmatimonadota bacterium]